MCECCKITYVSINVANTKKILFPVVPTFSPYLSSTFSLHWELYTGKCQAVKKLKQKAQSTAISLSLHPESQYLVVFFLEDAI